MSSEFLDFGNNFRDLFQQNSLEQHLGTTLFWHNMLLDRDRSPFQLKQEEVEVFNPVLDWSVLKASYDQLIAKATQDRVAASDVGGFLKILHPTLPEAMINQMLEPAPSFGMEGSEQTFIATPNYVGAATLAQPLDGDEADLREKSVKAAEKDFYRHLNLLAGDLTPNTVSTFYVQGNYNDRMVALAFWSAASVSYRMIVSEFTPSP